jgi:hypothetical protein
VQFRRPLESTEHSESENQNEQTIFGSIAAISLASGAGFAQTSANAEPSKTEGTTKVYHAGGRHDQRGHEATLRARARGQTMATNGQHAGGRHDVNGHEAAMRAEEGKPETGTTK